MTIFRRSNGLFITEDQCQEVKRRIHHISSQPLIVCVMGQTGVGKTSLLNALFGLNLPTDDVRPCTKQPERHVERTSTGHELWFWDMPGIGESSGADADYIRDYRTKISECDVALWACHADSRSVTFEVEALRKVIEGVDDATKRRMLSKLVFMLTKADLVSRDGWILSRVGDGAVLAPGEGTKQLLDEKAAYFRRSLIEPVADLLSTRTFHDGSFRVSDPRIRYDEQFVYYDGILGAEERDALARRYPKYADVFGRLHQNSHVIYCSARFRYQLTAVLRLIADKSSGEASTTPSHFRENAGESAC